VALIVEKRATDHHHPQQQVKAVGINMKALKYRIVVLRIVKCRVNGIKLYHTLTKKFDECWLIECCFRKIGILIAEYFLWLLWINIGTV
jgi:hypothetical protein